MANFTGVFGLRFSAASFTHSAPIIGAKMMMTGKWMKPGVFNVEEFDPDPFMDEIGAYGLPWNEIVNGQLAFHDYD